MDVDLAHSIDSEFALHKFTYSNNWSKQFDKKAAAPPHMDDSIVFARWSQCAPHLIDLRASLHQPESMS